MKSKGLILFLDTTHSFLPQSLEKEGYEVVLFSGDIQELKKQIKAAVGLVVRSKFVLNSDILKYAENLKFIARYGAEWKI